EEPYEHAVSHWPALLGVVFCVKQIGKSRAAVCAVAIGIILTAFRIFGESLVAQTDLVFAGAQLDDFELTVFAQLETILHVWPIRIIDFGTVAQPLESFIQFDEDCERRMPNNPASNRIADVVVREKLLPDIRLQLLDTKRQAVIVRVDVQDDSLDSF